MKRHFLFVTIFTTMFLAVGCASKANYSGDIQDEAPVENALGISGEAGQSQEPQLNSLPPAVDGPKGGLLDRRLIRFEYDKSAVLPEYLSVLSSHSEYLNQNPQARVILEGHADERGSNEYNLALGQRRSDAVRDIMLSNGVGRNQIETLSFGEESPINRAENETAWSENRRVEIRYHNE
ncbi:MAG: peptidoglycan-associated lipoprotein Pal [Gammaproteobacteria bacterium WSBS_2016_MAG_OTU1]